MKKCFLSFLGGALVVALAACDLEPKISSLPDSVGDFISERYPALLADPETEAEIYDSAVTDYGVYESPELYGTGAVGEYGVYTEVSDYAFETYAEPDDKVVAVKSFAKKGTSVEEKTESKPVEKNEPESDIVPQKEELPNDVLNVPGRKQEINPKTKQPEEKSKIVVAKGDTLYALARANNITVQDLITANNLSKPYVLYPGQELKLVKESVKPKPVEQVQDLIVPERKAVAPKQTEPVKKVEKKDSNVKESNKIETVQTKPATTETKKQVTKVEKNAPKPEPKHTIKTKNIKVKRGDTLYSVSRRYSVPVNDLAVMNGLRAPFALHPDQSLIVPDVPEVKIITKEQDKKIETKKPETVAKPEPKSVEKKPEVKKSETKKPESQKTETKPKTVNAPKTDVKKQQQVSKKDIKKDKTEKKKSESKVESKKSTQKLAARSSSKFSWPVRGTILSHFGAKSGGLFNDGINISAASGTSVRAAENGVVAYAGNEIKGMGNLVIIQHEGGWMTVYAHLNSMSVRRGARVNVGDKIGVVGQTGKVTKPQLHFEIRKGTKAYNPINYLKK
ncbi:MAG: peptidoglycan DD-metalloendopeptidase family protein [Alphaproteobacteria bacterium]|nr:peptidoglycan DD-metalloendopeptidase family protein [Alphaproteobacteria bacterium]